MNPMRYRGYYYDSETGLYYLQSRYYNPDWGRFVNADSLVDTVSGQNCSNVYAYCLNNPVNGCDPCGTCYHKAPYSSTYNFTCSVCAGYGGKANWNSYFPSTTSKTTSSTKSSTSSSKTPVVLQKTKPNMTPRKDSKKGSDTRQPTGQRERNVGHPEAEEHGLVPKRKGPKGYNGPKRIVAVGTLLTVSMAIGFVVGNDLLGVVVDDIYLENLTQIWWDTANMAFA